MSNNGFFLSDIETVAKAMALAYSRGKRDGDSFAEELMEIVEDGGKLKHINEEETRDLLKNTENIIDLRDIEYGKESTN